MWFETIVLGVNGDQKNILQKELVNQLLPRAFKQVGLKAIRIFQRPLKEADLAIAILWEEGECGDSGSLLGKNLMSVFKGICPVVHNVWQEISAPKKTT